VSIGRSLFPSVQRLGLVLRHRNTPVGLLRLLMLLVVGRLGVDRPQVMLRTRHHVVDGAHGGQHRVIGVVVPVQAVAADLREVGDRLQPLPDRVDALGVVGVVHGIGERHARYLVLEGPPALVLDMAGVVAEVEAAR
jgi:hypothetical protein